MNTMLKILLTSLVLIALTMAGCVESPSHFPSEFKPHARYSEVGVRLSVNYTEVERINMSEIKIQLNSSGFVVEESPPLIGFTLRNYTQNNTYNKTVEELTIFVSAYEQNSEKKGDFIVDYVPFTPSRDDESEKDNITAYIKMRANEVATICNITLNWSVAKWGWNYES